MKPTVVLTHWVHPEVIEYLQQSCHVIPNETRESLPDAELLSRMTDADGLMAFMPDTVDVAFLAQCPKLKVIAAALKGYDNFDVDACSQKGIWFTIAPQALTRPTAELAMALILGIARKAPTGDQRIRSGQFKGWRPILYGQGLDNTTVGILGMGAIGKALAEMLRGFHCQIQFHDPVPFDIEVAKHLNAQPVSMDALFETSDTLVITVPYSPATKHLIDANRIASCKPGALMINVGRGSVLDELAVANALRKGQLGGYAADVFEFEDWTRPDRPLTACPALLDPTLNTFFTPHLGSAVDSVRKEIAMEAAINLLQAFRGERPKGAINSPIKGG